MADLMRRTSVITRRYARLVLLGGAVLALSVGAAMGAAAQLVDHGGTVLTNPQVTAIYLGDYWSTRQGNADAFHTDAFLGAWIAGPETPPPPPATRLRRIARWASRGAIAIACLLVLARAALPLVLPSILSAVAGRAGLACSYERLELSLLAGELRLWRLVLAPTEGGDPVLALGFAEEGEREMFRLLIGVSGIGPVLAQTALSGMAVGDLQEAIFNERVKELTSIKGIGRKTAERLIIELKDKVRLSGPPAAAPGAPAGSRAVEEAVLALIALGIAPLAARQAVQRVMHRDGAELGVPQLIKRALQER